MNKPYPFRLFICSFALSYEHINTIYYIGSLIEESGCVNDQKRGKRKNWSGGKHKHSEPNKLTNQSAKRRGSKVVPTTSSNLNIKELRNG